MRILQIVLIASILAACGSKSARHMKRLDHFGIDTTNSVPYSLDVGTLAPVIQFTEVDSNGISTSYSSTEVVREKPLVVLFYRGHWCPVCNKYLSAFNDSLGIILERAEVWVVTPEKPEYVALTREKTGLTAKVISDTSQKIMKDYKVLFHVNEQYRKKIDLALSEDLKETNGDDVLPVPATYVIDENHKIVFKQFDPNYKNRATVMSILRNLP